MQLRISSFKYTHENFNLLEYTSQIWFRDTTSVYINESISNEELNPKTVMFRKSDSKSSSRLITVVENENTEHTVTYQT